MQQRAVVSAASAAQPAASPLSADMDPFHVSDSETEMMALSSAVGRAERDAKVAATAKAMQGETKANDKDDATDKDDALRVEIAGIEKECPSKRGGSVPPQEAPQTLAQRSEDRRRDLRIDAGSSRPPLEIACAGVSFEVHRRTQILQHQRAHSMASTGVLRQRINLLHQSFPGCSV